MEKTEPSKTVNFKSHSIHYSCGYAELLKGWGGNNLISVCSITNILKIYLFCKFNRILTIKKIVAKINLCFFYSKENFKLHLNIGPYNITSFCLLNIVLCLSIKRLPLTSLDTQVITTSHVRNNSPLR